MLNLNSQMEYQLHHLQATRRSSLMAQGQWLGIAPPSPDVVSWLQQQLDRFSYKQGWWWRVANTGHIHITMTAPNRDDPTKTISVGGAFDASYLHPGEEDLFAYLFASNLRRLEDHESREWFRRDGAIFDDPHAQDGDQ